MHAHSQSGFGLKLSSLGSCLEDCQEIERARTTVCSERERKRVKRVNESEGVE